MAKRGRINVRREGNRIKGAVIRQSAASYEAFLASQNVATDRDSNRESEATR